MSYKKLLFKRQTMRNNIRIYHNMDRKLSLAGATRVYTEKSSSQDGEMLLIVFLRNHSWDWSCLIYSLAISVQGLYYEMQRWHSYQHGRGQDHHTGGMRWPCELENWMGWNSNAKSATPRQDKLMTRVSALNWRFINCKKWRRRKLVDRMIMRYQCVGAAKRPNGFLGCVRHCQSTQRRTSQVSYEIVWRFLITCFQNKTCKCVQKRVSKVITRMGK